MDADGFRDYVLGFIFFKYLSEKQQLHANHLLETEKVKDYHLVTDEENIEALLPFKSKTQLDLAA